MMNEAPVMRDGWCGCYLLASRHPRCRGRTYIGFTVNPAQRIRRHNGEIANGAKTTHTGRPWEMVLVVHGFSSKAKALAFEWAWQHPRRSKAIRDRVAVYRLPASGGVEYLGLCPRGAATACASTTTAACASTTTATCASTTTLCASVLQDPQKGFKLPEKGGVFESFQRSNTYLKCEQGRE